MRLGGKRCLICDCGGTMRLDAAALERALGGAAPSTVHHQLCRAQIEAVRATAAGGEPLLIACTQEAPLFAETLEEIEGAPPAGFVNIRERAGWSEEGAEAAPKIAALLAEAAIEAPPAPALTLKSEGRCLVVGIDDTALQAARQLAPRLAPTLLLVADAEILPPRTTAFPILRGLVRGATGHLGAFEVEVADLAPADVSSRRRLRFGPAQAKAELEADLILDLTGGQPWFGAHTRRDGYLRPDPRDPVAVQRALFEAVGLTGEFEKPRYVAFTAELCAHSRSRRTGCVRCLEQCPTGAIAPAGDHVRIDPYVCAGCGACAGVCPTGAAAYAVPSANVLLERLRALLGTYRDAGGAAPVLLACEERHGEALVDAMARLGRGLPARVLPFAVTEIAQLGFETLAAAFAYGADQVVVLAPPRKRDEIGGLEATLGHVRAMLDGLGYGAERLLLLLEDDPDAVEAALWTLPHLAPVITAGDFLPMGGKRTLMRLALDQLRRTAPQPAEIVPMPAGAPFGAVVVDVAGCTLCLSCVGACPTGALLDNPDKPMLRFLEEACVQCGLCRSTCPENVIRLEPRLDFTAAARSPRTIKEEEPALCIRCGKPFGTQSSIERIVQKLAGRSWMFQTEEQIARIRMCDDCRVISQLENARNPLTFGSRPKPRTSEDYLREREQPAAPPMREPESETEGTT